MENNINKKSNTKKIAFMGLLFAVALILNWLESMIPLPGLLGASYVKLGLSNIVTMYTLLFIGKKEAFAIAFLKSSFVLLTRGPVAFGMSISGGLLSILIMMLLIMIFKDNISYLTLSVSGALAHNIGQCIMASIILSSGIAMGILPILLISGVVVGAITGLVLRIVIPALSRLNTNKTI